MDGQLQVKVLALVGLAAVGKYRDSWLFDDSFDTIPRDWLARSWNTALATDGCSDLSRNG